MKKRLRIFSNIAIICLSVCMFAFGVYAANQVSVTTSGTVTFTATGVYAKISGAISGITESGVTYADLTTNADGSIEGDVSTWSSKDLTFDSGKEITLTITIQNLATETGRNAYVRIKDNDNNVLSNNITKTISNNGVEETVAPGGSVELTISIKVKDANFSVEEEDFNFEIILDDVSSSVTDEVVNFTAINDNGNVVGYSLDGFKEDVDKSLYSELIVPAKYNDKPITKIKANAFENNSDLTYIVLPNTVTEIGDSAFAGCSSLTGNIQLPNLTTLGNMAFNNSNIISFHAEKLVTIGDGAFYVCLSLDEVKLQDVTTIGQHVFDGCGTNFKIYYSGTKEQWNAISFGDLALTSGKVKCSDGEIIIA